MGQILLQRPEIAELRKKGYTLVDMHVHSTYSCDGSESITRILKTAKRLGIGISITDHNIIKGSIEAKKHSKRLGVMVIPGIELRAAEGIDILIYFYRMKDLIDFYEKHVVPNKRRNIQHSSKLKISEISQILKEKRCLVCMAHPYRFYLKKVYNMLHKETTIRQLFNQFEIIEVINGKNLKRRNEKAIKKAKKLNKLIIGGSDAHRIKDIGSAVTGSRKSGTVERFLENITHSKDIVVIGKETKLSYRVVRPLISLKNALKHKIKEM